MTLKTRAALIFGVVLWAFACGKCYGKQILIAQKVSQPPPMDGTANDNTWNKVKAIVTYDKIAKIEITLKAVYTDKNIYVLAVFPDPVKHDQGHRSWIWNKEKQEYEEGTDREDTIVLKWNMGDKPVDLSVFADTPYKSDIWYWKAFRTGPLGYADDKIDILSSTNEPYATKITSKTGGTMYYMRKGDGGDGTYETEIPLEYKGDKIPRFKITPPTGDRADIKAKGVWKDKKWAVVFCRALNTGHNDTDVQFDPNDPNKLYEFGVSRYEIMGDPPKAWIDEPLFNSGDISEELWLKFAR